MKTIILDSSQISLYLECEQKWEFTNVENITASNSVKDDLMKGTYGHKWLEIYYSNLHLGISEAVELADSFDPLKHNLPLPLDQVKLVKDRLRDYWMIYSNRDFVPLTTRKHEIMVDLESGLPFDNYVQVPLVEQGFSYELLHTREYLFVLEGKIDLICLHAANNTFVDHKFQGRRHDLYEKSIQFRNYSLATKLNMGIINYIRLTKTVEKETFVRQPIYFSSQEQRLWKEELTEIYISIARDSNNPHPFKRRSSCPGKYGSKCEFIRICDETNLAAQQAIKETHYIPREEWKPW